MPTSHFCITWHSSTCNTPSTHKYRVLRGLQLRVQGFHAVHKEGSNGCLGTYWCHGVLHVRIDGRSLESIMWVLWNRLLQDQEMKTWIIITSHTNVLTLHSCVCQHSTSCTCLRHSTFTTTPRGEFTKYTLPNWPFQAPSVKGKHNMLVLRSH